MQEQLDLGNIPYTMPKYLSPSAIGTFNQCPMRYRFSKLDKIPEPSTEAQVLGSYVHEVLELLFQIPAEDRTESSARGIAKNLWEEKWGEEYFSLDKKSDRNEFRWKVWWCIENYFSLEDPTSFTPEGLESKVEGDIDGVPIFGIIDRWNISDSGKLIISDYKTGKKPRPQYEWEKKMQIMIYVELLEKMLGLEAEKAELIYLKSPSRAVYEPNAKIRNEVKVTLRNTWDELTDSCSTGEFECRTGPLCNWCSFKQICPAWRKS